MTEKQREIPFILCEQCQFEDRNTGECRFLGGCAYWWNEKAKSWILKSEREFEQLKIGA